MILVYMSLSFSSCCCCCCKFNFSIQLFTFSLFCCCSCCYCGLETTKKIYKLFKLMPSRKLSSSIYLKSFLFCFVLYSYSKLVLWFLRIWGSQLTIERNKLKVFIFSFCFLMARRERSESVDKHKGRNWLRT